MDHQDIRTLKILEEIENDHSLSQRDIARSLNVSLGLVNSFVKRLVHKGYFKVTTIPKNRVRYILTAKGAAEKSRLTYEYIQYSFQFYRAARQKLRKVLHGLEAEGVEQVIIYGANELAEIIYICLKETHIELADVVDDARKGETLLEHKINGSSALHTLVYDRVIVASFDSIEEIKKKIIENDVPQSKICILE